MASDDNHDTSGAGVPLNPLHLRGSPGGHRLAIGDVSSTALILKSWKSSPSPWVLISFCPSGVEGKVQTAQKRRTPQFLPDVNNYSHEGIKKKVQLFHCKMVNFTTTSKANASKLQSGTAVEGWWSGVGPTEPWTAL